MLKSNYLLSKNTSLFLYIFGPTLILTLALFRLLPSIFLEQPVEFFNNPTYKRAQYLLWTLIILFCVLCELCIHSSQNIKEWQLLSGLYIGALIFAYILMVFFAHGWVNEASTSPWNTFYIEADTKSYIIPYQIESVRTPIYPLFTQAVSSGTAANIPVNSIPFNQPIENSFLPLLHIVQAQKLFLYASALVLGITLVYLFHSVLPIPIVLLILDFDFFTTYKAYVMSETLAQAFLILLIVSFLVYLYYQWRWLLPFSGLLVALNILTRPSSAYCLIIFGAILVWAFFKDFKRSKFYILAALSISAIFLFSYIGALYLRFDKWILAPISFYQRMGTALVITEPEDASLMPDADLLQYYQLIQKGIVDYGYKSKPGTAERIMEFDSNIYRIALPAAHEMSARGTHYSEDELLDKTANIIISHHIKEYIQLSWSFFIYAWNDSRFNFSDGGLSIVLGFILIISVLLHNKNAFAAIILALTHIANFIVCSVFGIPLVRYTRLTELLLIVSSLVLLEGLFNKLPFSNSKIKI